MMSKLAAICAKLKDGAVAVNDITSSSPLQLKTDTELEDRQPLFPRPQAEITDTDDCDVR